MASPDHQWQEWCFTSSFSSHRTISENKVTFFSFFSTFISDFLLVFFFIPVTFFISVHLLRLLHRNYYRCVPEYFQATRAWNVLERWGNFHEAWLFEPTARQHFWHHWEPLIFLRYLSTKKNGDISSSSKNICGWHACNRFWCNVYCILQSITLSQLTD